MFDGIQGFLGRLYAMAAKELLHMLRDPQVIYLALGMPLVLVLLFGYAVRFDVEEVRLAVVDEDHTPSSRSLLERLDASDAFQVVARPADSPGTGRNESGRRSPLAFGSLRAPLANPEEVEALFRRGGARAAIVVPKGYERHLLRGEKSDVELLVDGSDGTTAGVAMSYAAGVAQAETVDLISKSVSLTMPIEPRIRTWFNPRMESPLFVVPGLVAMILAIIGVLLAALAVAREWERGSMEQLFATPVDRVSVVLGKVAPYLLLGLMQFLLVLVAGAYLFDVPLRGSFATVLAAATLFLISVLGQGLFISMVTKNQQVATQVGAVSAILPSLLLSGFLFPVQNMPLVLRGISHIVPAGYLITCLRAVLLQGRGIESLWSSFLGLAIFALVILTLTTLRFRRRLD